MRPKTLSLLASAALAAGCSTGGDFRRISFSSDLTPGDLAHFRAKAERAGEGGEIVDASVGLPLLFFPLISRSREGTADRVGPDRWHFHFEDDNGIGFFLLRASRTANFDEEGRNLSYRRSLALLFGVLDSATGHARRADGTYAATSAFSLLWGAFSTERTPVGRSWTILWFPIVSASG
ncbi:MAG TPA: hypothetical protein VFI25_14850 [Planctomycetota bacterium]|jgi:hypothetical protein|nr:hypothetical protein [Planctomycetota bacterium]